MQVVHDCKTPQQSDIRSSSMATVWLLPASPTPEMPTTGSLVHRSIDAHPARGKMHLGTMQEWIKTPSFTHGNQGQLSCQVPLPCKKERIMRHSAEESKDSRDEGVSEHPAAHRSQAMAPLDAAVALLRSLLDSPYSYAGDASDGAPVILS